MSHLALNLALVAALIWFTTVCRADLGHRISIFQVKKSIPLADEAPVYRDFYINSGSESEIKVGMIIPVKRRVPVHDPVHNKLAGDLYIKVGELKVIHVGNGLSVGRLVNTLNESNRPILEFEGVMVGDRLDVHRARFEDEELETETPMVLPRAEVQPEPEKPEVPNDPQIEMSSEMPPKELPKRKAQAPGPLLL